MATTILIIDKVRIIKTIIPVNDKDDDEELPFDLVCNTLFVIFCLKGGWVLSTRISFSEHWALA